MKLSDIKVYTVATPAPHFGGRYWIFVKLTTACGIDGIGEVYSPPFHPSVVEKMIEDVFERNVKGNAPSEIERMYRNVYSTGYSQRPDPTLMSIFSGIETACWDIQGKALNRPVYDLLGGKVRDRLRSYTYLYPKPEDKTNVYADSDLAAERAAEYVAQGFTGIKFDPAGPYTAFDGRFINLEDMDRAETFCRKIREAVGSKADLLFGTHGQMTPASAIRLAQRLEKYEPLWFEEPTPPDMPEEMALVARGTKIPVSTGERLVSKYEFSRVLQNRAASILQFAVGRVGGIWEAKKIAGMAETFYAQIAPHLYCGPVEEAANIHLCLSTPNFLIQESIQDMRSFHGDVLKTPIKWEEGYLYAHDAPGLGIELNEDVITANPYTDNDLHLEFHPYDFDF
ncbi:mandelate racemase/muconate lactonizing enzyme family protein [Curvivirga sp.]|uniref:mandelate racemase/muconate lactonizing enzyme family protein n=1 Tax=Curvivirga sp. TaxID=2856848 RepID=UPI003B5A65C1